MSAITITSVQSFQKIAMHLFFNDGDSSQEHFKGNPNFQGILNKYCIQILQIQILHYYCRKQHKNVENSRTVEQNVALSLCSSLCLLRLALPSPSSTAGYFQFLDTVLTSQLIIRDVYSFVFCFENGFLSKLSLAKYRCLHKNHTYFMSSITTELLYKSLSFITSSAQIFLKLY